MKTKQFLLASVAVVLLTVTFASDSVSADSSDVQATTPAKPYPLQYCVVSGDKFDAMGSPVTLRYKDQEMRFCCKDCITEFKKDPDKYITKLRAEKNASVPKN